MPLFGRHHSQNDQQGWFPDQSLPYVIHYLGSDKEDKTVYPHVCIWPRAKHVSNSNQDYDLLEYTLNREHGCVGRILEKCTSSIRFADMDGHFGVLFDHHGPATVTIAVMTDDEFEVVKRNYEKTGWITFNPKGDDEFEGWFEDECETVKRIKDERWPTFQTKEDLVKYFIECLDD